MAAISEFDLLAEYLSFRVCQKFAQSGDIEEFCVSMLQELLCGPLSKARKTKKLEILLSLVTVCYQACESNQNRDELAEHLEAMSLLVPLIVEKTGVKKANDTTILASITSQLILAYVEADKINEAKDLLEVEQANHTLPSLAFLQKAVSSGKKMTKPEGLQYESFLSDMASFVEQVLIHLGTPLLSLFVREINQQREPPVYTQADVIMIFREMILKRIPSRVHENVEPPTQNASTAERGLKTRPREDSGSHSEEESRELFDNSSPELLAHSSHHQSGTNRNNRRHGSSAQQKLSLSSETQQEPITQKNPTFVHEPEPLETVRTPTRESTPRKRKRNTPSKQCMYDEVSSSQDEPRTGTEAVSSRSLSCRLEPIHDEGNDPNNVEFIEEQHPVGEQPTAVENCRSLRRSSEERNPEVRNSGHVSREVSVEWTSDEDEDAVISSARSPPGRCRQTGYLSRRKFWTQHEEMLLRKGVERFGVGNWARILSKYNFEGRTSVNLKDKWRNMQK